MLLFDKNEKENNDQFIEIMQNLCTTDQVIHAIRVLNCLEIGCTRSAFLINYCSIYIKLNYTFYADELFKSINVNIGEFN